jgi:hypothetical protein
VQGDAPVGPLWIWTRNGYRPVDDMLPVRGHMVFLSAPQTVEISVEY